jgi:hypothetical protein
LGSSTWSKESGDERVQVDVPLSNMGLNLFVKGRQKLVRGRVSCAGKEE